MSQEEEIVIAGATELFDYHLDIDQAIVFDKKASILIQSNFECRICMKITKNVLVCSNEDCSIPICFECSEKLKSDSKCCPNRCSGEVIIL